MSVVDWPSVESKTSLENHRLEIAVAMFRRNTVFAAPAQKLFKS